MNRVECEAGRRKETDWKRVVVATWIEEMLQMWIAYVLLRRAARSFLFCTWLGSAEGAGGRLHKQSVLTCFEIYSKP